MFDFVSIKNVSDKISFRGLLGFLISLKSLNRLVQKVFPFGESVVLTIWSSKGAHY
jgi:hypothetical protein